MLGKIYFFDVDHTLIRGSTGRRFAVVAARRGVIRFRSLASIPISYFAYRLGIGGAAFFDREFGVIRGIERGALEKLADEAFALSIRAAIRPGIAALIARLKSEGLPVVLATSSIDFIVRPLAEHLGVDEVLSSRMEFVDGRSTGRFEGGPLLGQAKFERAARCARERGAELGDCAFYSDSAHDLPLLRAVGRPVAVAPDFKLRKAAREGGWEILEA